MFKETILPIFQQNAAEQFQIAKDYILQEVENHGICQELRSKSTGSLYLESSSSTLFGFMGFDADFDPVGYLLDFLDKNIKQKNTIRLASYTLISSLSLPTKKTMRQDSGLRMPWLSEESWPEAIENGVSGLQFFLGKEGKGRSGLGIQAKVAHDPERELQKVRDADMAGVPFLSPIFAAAKKIG